MMADSAHKWISLSKTLTMDVHSPMSYHTTGGPHDL